MGWGEMGCIEMGWWVVRWMEWGEWDGMGWKKGRKDG